MLARRPCCLAAPSFKVQTESALRFLFLLDSHFDLLWFAVRLVVRMCLLEGLVLGQFGRDPVDNGELRHVHVVPVCV